MANIRKSFNFRTGLQVDNDNFVVNANGLVGIGTSIPQGYLLNVHGDTRVTGLVTTGELYAGIGTVGVLSATSADVSGILSVAQIKVGSSSVISNLVGYGYTAWITNDGGVGLHTLSRVGIGTGATPTEQLKVFGDVAITTSLTVGSATTIASYGINAPSGIVTASKFVGVGSDLTNLDASNVALGTLSNSRLPSNISVSGIVTATTFVGSFTGTATTATNLYSAANITAGTISDDRLPDLITSNINVSSGVSTVSSIDVGTGGTAFTALSSGRLGIGTALPTSEIQVRKASGSLVEVVSDSGQARISVGQSVGAGKSTGVIRFGNSAHDFDIINNDNEGDINFLLNGNGSAGTGKFSWQDGNSFTEVMSLNANGDFSVSGVTTLASAGSTTTTGGDLYVNGDLDVNGSINGTITLPTIIDSNINVNSGVSTFNDIELNSKLFVSVGSSIGIGTDTPIAALDARTQTGLFLNVGVNTESIYSNTVVSAYGNVIVDGGVGINTNYFDPSGAGLQLYAPLTELNDGHFNLKYGSTVGFNTDDPRAIFDFGNVGSATTRPMMVVPNITDGVRDTVGYAVTPTGSIIFNTTTSKFQGYDGSNWVDFH